MGKPTGFMEYKREVPQKKPPAERIRNYQEFLIQLPVAKLREQGARCMDCGIPFCHTGCPLGNIIPDFNDLVYHGDWEEALKVLHSTNNFPEFTGRICPAPCEEACVLGINQPPVTIKNIELSIIELGFEEGWIKPESPQARTGKRVAVIGSGPAGLACAQQLNRAGHWVTIFERADHIGGLLRYGIPDFKMSKYLIDRRVEQMEAEGVSFSSGVNVGVDIDADQLKNRFDVIVLCGGSTRPRDLTIPGRELEGIHFAMEFLPQQNRRVAQDPDAAGTRGWWFSDYRKDILATDKHVIIIGGGDTGSDCVGTCNRQRAKSVTQFELLPKPPQNRPGHQPWPYWPMKLRTSTSHEEGIERYWGILTKRFKGVNGKVIGLETVGVEYENLSDGLLGQMREVSGMEETWPADLVLLAVGFVGPETDGIITQLGIELDEHNNVKTDRDYMTNIPGVFACGDMRRGQSLVVWAISEGREAARGIDKYLMGKTHLPTKGAGDLPPL
ncbi:MAG: glutamate synthase subunit beta [Planctomycetota bacterium]|nr:MAG: glutamate synthase subunit beta [Planctomycetota bacterium]